MRPAVKFLNDPLIEQIITEARRFGQDKLPDLADHLF
jgi:hypothetical protein